MPKTVSDLTPAPYNPRRITEQQLTALGRAMKEFGDLSGIVFNRRTGRIVGGHQRIKHLDPSWEITLDPAAPQADEVGTVATGRIKTPFGSWQYREVDWEEKKEIAANLAANNHGGEFDLPKVKELLSGLASEKFDLLLTGFDERELMQLIKWSPESGIGDSDGASPDETTELPANPVTKPGDIWRMGGHRLICADSADLQAIGRLFADEPPDFIFTSPPYNVGVNYDGHEDATVAWDEYRRFLQAVISVWFHKLPEGRMAGWNIGTSPKTYHHLQHALIESGGGLQFFRQMIWKKIGVPVPLWFNTRSKPVVRRFTPNYQHEIILLFSKGKPHLGGIADIDELCENDVFEIHQSSSTRDLPAGSEPTGAQSNLETRARKAHPAAYPVRLPLMFIRHLCDKGAIVGDPFCGSGSTIIAAEQSGRRGYGSEISPAYCDVAVDRWQKFTGGSAKRI